MQKVNLPNFFIVGAPKCGTTAMYEYLRQHPQIFMPEHKEPHFFAPELATPRSKPYADKERYLALFADAGDHMRIGEASVMYLYSASAARAIHDFNPAARIIIMLRSPIEMVYSWYYQQVKSGNETLPSFEAALAAEPARRQGQHNLPRVQVDKLFYRSVVRFVPQITRYFETFGRDSVHIIIYDDFKLNTAQSYQDTLRFLGVEPGFQPEFEVVNENQLIRFRRVNRLRQRPPHWFAQLRAGIANAASDEMRQFVNNTVNTVLVNTAPRPTMSPAIRAQLQQEFLPDIQQLSELLGRDLTHWCRD